MFYEHWLQWYLKITKVTRELVRKRSILCRVRSSNCSHHEWMRCDRSIFDLKMIDNSLESRLCNVIPS